MSLSPPSLSSSSSPTRSVPRSSSLTSARGRKASAVVKCFSGGGGNAPAAHRDPNFVDVDLNVDDDDAAHGRKSRQLADLGNDALGDRFAVSNRNSSTGARPNANSRAVSPRGGATTSTTTSTSRNLTGTAKAQMQTQNHNRQQQKQQSSTNGLSNRSSSWLTISANKAKGGASSDRSRSLSPTPSSTNSSTTPTAGAGKLGSPRLSSASSSSFILPRRKSTQQLEDEYRDSDDDLPDDANLWNVPISPRPGGHRHSYFGPQNGHRLADSSPASVATTPAPPGAVRIPLPTSESFAAASSFSSSQPFLSMPSSTTLAQRRQNKHAQQDDQPHADKGRLSATKPPLQRSTSADLPHPPAQETVSRQRASRVDLMADLSLEARALTHSLEMHAEQEALRYEAAVQNSSKSKGKGKSGSSSSGNPRHNSLPLFSGSLLAKNSSSHLSPTDPDANDAGSPLSLQKRKSAGAVELPPVQRQSIMLDPLPVSKEKEMHLSRTRPSWLPPKDKKEERKHLKEYKRMMVASREADRRRAVEATKRQCEKDDTRKSLQRVWDEHVLPNWDRAVNEPGTRQLWWRGITPRSRGEVWQRAIGNELGLTAESYNKALERARGVRLKLEERGRDTDSSAGNGSGSRDAADDDQRHMEQCFAEIRRDAGAAFSDLKLFAPGAPLRDTLIDLLDAYIMYRNDIGYAHGMHTIAALLLLTLPSPSAAFTTMANALNRPLPLAFLTLDPGACSRVYSLASSALRLSSPRLWAYITETLGVPVSALWGGMLGCLLTNGLDLERASRVWDCWVFDGDIVMVAGAVAVVRGMEARILGIAGEDGQRRLGGQLGVGVGVGAGEGGKEKKTRDYWDLQSLGDPDGFMAVVGQVARRIS